MVLSTSQDEDTQNVFYDRGKEEAKHGKQAQRTKNTVILLAFSGQKVSALQARPPMGLICSSLT